MENIFLHLSFCIWLFPEHEASSLWECFKNWVEYSRIRLNNNWVDRGATPDLHWVRCWWSWSQLKMPFWQLCNINLKKFRCSVLSDTCCQRFEHWLWTSSLQNTRSVRKVRMHRISPGELQPYSRGGSTAIYFEPSPLRFNGPPLHDQVAHLTNTCADPYSHQMRCAIRDELPACMQEGDHQWLVRLTWLFCRYVKNLQNVLKCRRELSEGTASLLSLITILHFIYRVQRWGSWAVSAPTKAYHSAVYHLNFSKSLWGLGQKQSNIKWNVSISDHHQGR